MLRLSLLTCVLCTVTVLVGCESHPVGPPAELAASGCWVQIFERDNMNINGAWDVINGPGEWRTLINLPGARTPLWDDRIDSLIVGPHARVTLWANDYFDDDKLEFGPGSRIPALGRYDFEHEPESMKIEYVP